MLSCLDKDHSIILKEHSLHSINKECEYFYKLDEYSSPIINSNVTWYNPFTWHLSYQWIKKRLKGEIEVGNLLTRDHADNLITKLKILHKSYDNIYLIGHSMGGLIILESLFKLFSSSNNKLLSKIKKVVFIASPLAGSDDSDDIKKFFDKKLSKNIFSQAVKELNPKSQTIANIKKGITETYRENLKDLNCLFMTGKTDARILPESVEFARSFCEIESFEKNHSTIKEPENTEDDVYMVLEEFIFHTPNSLYEKSIQGIKTIWHTLKEIDSSHCSHIALESHYTHTIYANGIYIAHHKYKFEMMEDGTFDTFYHKIIPFDKNIEYNTNDKTLKEDEYYKNNPGNRFNGKAYKIIHYPKTLPIESLEPIVELDGTKKWIRFNFKSKIMPKGTPFWIEISISDKIDFTDTKRINEYFESTINNKKRPHALRHITYQLETYNDHSDTDVALTFVPWATADKYDPWLNHKNCQESIYYKTWKWKFHYSEKNPRSIRIELHNNNNYKKSGSPCENLNN